MALVRDMVLGGMVRLWAQLVGGTTQGAVTVGAGNNSQALAVPLVAAITRITTASATANTGVVLPSSMEAGDNVVVRNNDGVNAALIYPPVGGTINALSQNAGFSLAANKTAIVYCHDTPGQTFSTVLTA